MHETALLFMAADYNRFGPGPVYKGRSGGLRIQRYEMRARKL